MRNENMSNTATISQGQEILALQDELTGALIGLARSCGNNPKTENTDEIIIEGLVHTITNSNTGAAALKAMIEKVREEKEAFFRQADIFVFPTYYETFGLVILEAMEYKLPVISTNEGGIPDIVKDGENGLICEKQNPYSLADCIAKLLDDEELRVKMGNAGYDKFCREFTLQQFEHRMLDILSQNLPQKEKEN